MGNYLVRDYTAGDDEKIVKLLDTVFDPWPNYNIECSKTDHWIWKYLDAPYEPRIVTVAQREDRIVGSDHSIIAKLKINEKELKGAYTADLAVHPDYRRMGIANGMIKRSEKMRRENNLDFIYYVSTRSFLVAHFTNPFPYPILNLARIRDIDLQLKKIPIKNSLLNKIGFNALNIANKVKYSLKKPIENINIQLIEAYKFDLNIEEFNKKIYRHYKFIVKKPLEYLNWRYTDPRAGSFKILQALDNEQVLGYAVLRVNRYRSDYPIGYILELIAIPGRIDAADKLLSEAVRYFVDQGINIINCQVVKGHPYEDLYQSYGFLDSRIKFQIYTDLKHRGMDKLLYGIKPDEIYFSYGDLDSLPFTIPKERK